MGKEKGSNFKVYVKDGASVPAYHLIAGQITGQLKINGQAIDVSDKDDGAWGTSLDGPKSMTVTISGNCKWPDTAGLDAIRDIVETENEHANIKVVLNSDGDMYECECVVTDLTYDGPNNGATTYSMTFNNFGVPVYTAG